MNLTVEEKVKIINDFKNSGVTATQFAPTRNVSVISLRNWVKRYEQGGIEALKTKYEK
ncbi:helix-turn-helix domain-containing protein [Spiroplasma endosymbiont of Atherix ibis]|uniref:helix-turn-helix domain-containing protein n=1 Tax=Spiroplasma endosymbiont of Atherix ibis TaxID=3066291 RepID=UPI0030CCAC4A